METMKAPSRQPKPTSLKPTYEGWKPEDILYILQRSNRLKPTYEGWKQLGLCMTGKRGPAFEAYL